MNRAGGMDFRRAGARGTYVLVKNWRNPALNMKIDKFIKEADSMRVMSLKQCRQGWQTEMGPTSSHHGIAMLLTTDKRNNMQQKK